MSFFYQFGLLFANMEWFVAVCLVVGLALLFVEIFIPGFGLFGISGISLVIVGTILRAIFHQDNDIIWLQVLQLTLLLTLAISLAFFLFVLSTKQKWFKKNPIFSQDSTAVDLIHSQGTDDFRSLVGQFGYTITALRPAGKISIDKNIYDVTAESFFVEEGKNVEVVLVEGSKIVVRSIK